MVIDADTHVEETEETWQYVPAAKTRMRPRTLSWPVSSDGRPSAYWLIEGKPQLKFLRTDEATGVLAAARELRDIPLRLTQMDHLGVSVQVIFPTLFLGEFTTTTEVHTTLRTSYNRWIAQACSESQHRLRWICLPPYLDRDAAISEMQFARSHGAVGILKKGDLEAGRWLDDEYFMPIYEEAQRLDLSICFHVGTGHPNFLPMTELSSGRSFVTHAPVVYGLELVLRSRLPERFPDLRFGFFEAGASWVPYVLHRLQRISKLQGHSDKLARIDWNHDLLRQSNIFISCQPDEDLSYLLAAVGEDNIVTGSDFGHDDPGTELQVFQRLSTALAFRSDHTQLLQKIAQDNPKRLYGL